MEWNESIKAAIFGILSSVDGIDDGQAKVYDRPIYSRDIETHYQSFVTTAGKFHVWFFKRYAFTQTGSIGAQILRETQVRLFGYYAISEDSEHDFQEVIDNVAATFDAPENFGLSGTVAQHAPMNLVESADESYGGVLCHKAILEFTFFS